jgi:hypothetical protein
MWHECTRVLPRSAYRSILPVLPSPQSRWPVSNWQKSFSLAKDVAFNICVNKMAWWLEGGDIRGTNEIGVEVVKLRNCFLWPHYKWSANKPTEESITWSDCMQFICGVLIFDNVEFYCADLRRASLVSRSWDCGLESRWLHGCLSHVNIVLSRNGLFPRLEESYRLSMYPCARSGETITLYTYKCGERGRNKQKRKQEREKERKREFIVCLIAFHPLEQNWELYRIMQCYNLLRKIYTAIDSFFVKLLLWHAAGIT